MKYDQNNAYLQHEHGSPPNASAGATTRLETKSAYACKAQLMGCHLVHVTSGSELPTIL